MFTRSSVMRLSFEFGCRHSKDVLFYILRDQYQIENIFVSVKYIYVVVLTVTFVLQWRTFIFSKDPLRLLQWIGKSFVGFIIIVLTHSNLCIFVSSQTLLMVSIPKNDIECSPGDKGWLLKYMLSCRQLFIIHSKYLKSNAIC